MGETELTNHMFVVTHVDGRREIRPASFWGQLGFVFFLFGAGLMVYIASFFLKRVGEGLTSLAFAAIPLALAVMLVWMAVVYWRRGQTPLVAESTGRLSYGTRELCPGGSVRAVRIDPDPQAEHGDCRVVVELAEGKMMQLPMPFFGAISQREAARALGRELAQGLAVNLIELD
jgi:hypothetical protein